MRLKDSKIERNKMLVNIIKDYYGLRDFSILLTLIMSSSSRRKLRKLSWVLRCLSVAVAIDEYGLLGNAPGYAEDETQ
jgi:hypothetical protein